MIATVHHLPSAARAAAGASPRGSALLAGLRERVASLLVERLQRMFDGADDFLFEMSEKARNDDQQRLYFDTMRTVRLERMRIVQDFRQEMLHIFSQPDAGPGGVGDEIDFAQLQMQNREELEQKIALSNMAGKAEAQYVEPLWELDLRLRWLDRHLPVQLPRRALAPAGFCEAFRASLASLDVEFDVRLVILKLFDRLVMGELGPVYTGILALMQDHGVQAEKPTSARPSAGAPLPPTVQPAPPGSPAPFDERTLSALQSFGSMVQAPGAPAFSAAYNDAALAEDLLQAAQGRELPGLEPGHAWAMTQRAGLVGRMFNEILEDTNLPPSLVQALEVLRFPVIKTALTDSGFFARTDHPVRSLVNQLADMAAASRASGPEAMEPFEQLVRKVREQFDLQPDRVRPAVRAARALSEGDIGQFVQQQQAQGKSRRQALIERTRLVVAQELELRTPAREISAEALALLRSGWAPMMALRLLRHGARSPDWTSGMDLLQRVLQALEPQQAQARTPEQRQVLRGDLADALLAAGLPRERVEQLLAGLDLTIDRLSTAVVDDPSREAANGPVPVTQPEPIAPAQALELLLTRGSWFRIYDHLHRDTRWLKVVAIELAQHAVTFAEFDGRNTLRLDTRDLLVDLLTQRTEPIDPSPAASHALTDLRRRAA